MSNITIVTAFFDIGRGEISTEDYPNYLKRTTDTYFEYFSNLAQLENDMVVFTSKEFEQRILDIRKEKNTKVIIFDFKNKLNYHRKLISNIQNNLDFINKINPEQRKNIEYWSADYVMINNMKTLFVNMAIQQGLSTHQIAWLDFGYIRDLDTLNNIKEWKYDFNPEKVHFFSINKNIKDIKNFEQVTDFIFNNQVFLIGGCIVATSKKWGEFLVLLHHCQKELIQNNIIDDDQGLYVMCLYKKPDLFQINFLGKNKWFDLFKKYDKTAKISPLEKIKDHFGW
ncbi:protein YibB [Moraxella caprae]|uniref:Protein YibB n=1 Tax=Moraxella caprae TaxID=90240 RepID=A0A378R0H7_9GAMM|nr:WlaTC/HtrL family glycosyltransferase [Moraxella caprae]STZ08826.1 protein YibB [Moraxella caprae]